MTSKRYALIADGETRVDNMILAASGFSLKGYTLVEIGNDVFCQPGMYYNAADGGFYGDAASTSTPSQDSDESS